MPDVPSFRWLQMSGFTGACCYAVLGAVARVPGGKRIVVAVDRIEEVTVPELRYVVTFPDGAHTVCFGSHVAEVGWLPVEEPDANNNKAQQ